MQSLFIIVLREIKADGRKLHSIFFSLILQKSKEFFLLFMYINKSRPFTIPIIFMTERSCFHCWKRNTSSDCSSDACVTFKHSTFTMQPVHYHYIKQPVKHMEKHTALFKYVVKSMLFSVITAVKLCKTFCFMWIL